MIVILVFRVPCVQPDTFKYLLLDSCVYRGGYASQPPIRHTAEKEQHNMTEGVAGCFRGGEGERDRHTSTLSNSVSVHAPVERIKSVPLEDPVCRKLIFHLPCPAFVPGCKYFVQDGDFRTRGRD